MNLPPPTPAVCQLTAAAGIGHNGASNHLFADHVIELTAMAMTRRDILKVAAAGLAAVGWDENPAAADEGHPRRTVHEVIAAQAQSASPALQYRGSSPAEYHEWQKRFREQLDSLLGDCQPPEKWQTIEERRTELNDHTRLSLLLRADGVPDLPLYLLLPKGVSSKSPAAAVVCIHGHGAFGHDPVVGCTDLPGAAEHIRSANYDYGLQFVRRGYVVAAPCMIPFGRRVDRKAYGGNDPCAVTFVRMQASGQLPMAANLRDLMWSVSFLQDRPEVVPENIGAAGLSYGGRMTMLLTAIDERIKVAAISGALNLLQERMTLRHSCGSQIIPGLLKYGDYSEIGSLIAPRPAVWEVGGHDPLIKKSWGEVFADRLQRAYVSLGVADRLQFDHFDGGHRWHGDVAYPLFDSVLKA